MSETFEFILALIIVLLYCCTAILLLGYGLGYGLYWLVKAVLEGKKEVRKHNMFVIRDILETTASMLFLAVIVILFLINYPESWLSWPKYVVAGILALGAISLPWQHRCPKCRSHRFFKAGKVEEAYVPNKCYYGTRPTKVQVWIIERTCKRCGHVWTEDVRYTPCSD